MEKHYFFYSNQAVEFERPKVPEIVAKKGIKARIKASKTKAVILNVCDKRK